MKLATLILWLISPNETHVVTLTIPEDQCALEILKATSVYISQHQVRAWCVSQPPEPKAKVKP